MEWLFEGEVCLAFLETVTSCTAQQCSVDWKVSPHILSCFCQQFAKISSLFLHSGPVTSAATSLFHWNSSSGVGVWGVQLDWVTVSVYVMSIVLPYEFIFYIVHICNNSKKGKQDIFRYLIHLASVCSIISKDHGQIYLF